jgi:hypothetical protein
MMKVGTFQKAPIQKAQDPRHPHQPGKHLMSDMSTPPSQKRSASAGGAMAAGGIQRPLSHRPDPSTTRRRRWYLGIQSKKEPAAVMTEVYKALDELKCEWQTLASYRVRCRWVPTA